MAVAALTSVGVIGKLGSRFSLIMSITSASDEQPTMVVPPYVLIFNLSFKVHMLEQCALLQVRVQVDCLSSRKLTILLLLVIPLLSAMR
eukprot:3709715-Ditylum_brightwellii.AAC.1